jgi:hypothetical protein
MICTYEILAVMIFYLMFLWFMVLNATFNNISVISILLVEETEENHRPIAGY